MCAFMATTSLASCVRESMALYLLFIDVRLELHDLALQNHIRLNHLRPEAHNLKLDLFEFSRSACISSRTAATVRAPRMVLVSSPRYTLVFETSVTLSQRILRLPESRKGRQLTTQQVVNLDFSHVDFGGFRPSSGRARTSLIP